MGAQQLRESRRSWIVATADEGHGEIRDTTGIAKMFSALIITALLAGVPVSEAVARPICERLEVIDRAEPWTNPCWPRRLRWCATLPMMNERAYLPPEAYCHESLMANYHHRRWLECQAETNIDRCYRVWIDRAEWHNRWWDFACDAQRDFWWVVTRREAIGKCRDMIGREAFYACCWPTALPMEFYRWAD